MPPPFTPREWNQGWKHRRTRTRPVQIRNPRFARDAKGGWTSSDIFTRARAANEKRTKISNSIFSPRLVLFSFSLFLSLSFRAQEVLSFASLVSANASLVRLAGNTRTWLKFIFFVSKGHYHKNCSFRDTHFCCHRI